MRLGPTKLRTQEDSATRTSPSGHDSRRGPAARRWSGSRSTSWKTLGALGGLSPRRHLGAVRRVRLSQTAPVSGGFGRGQRSARPGASLLSLAAAIPSRLLAPACLPRFARPHVRRSVGSQCRTHFVDGALPVSSAVGACGAVTLLSAQPDVQGEDTGDVDLMRLARGSPHSAGSRAAPSASAVLLSPRR